MKLQLSSSNDYLFNKSNIPVRYNNLPPVYISIPIIAFRVSYVEHNNPENIIETTIVKLKKIGYSKEKIAKKLCLDEHLVYDVLEYYGDEISAGEKTFSQNNKTAYVFYDCYNRKYLDWYMDENDYKTNTDLYITDRQRYSFKFKSSISDSFEYFVRILQNPDVPVSVGMSPSQEEILRIFQSQKKYRAISSSYYSNAEYLNESRLLQMVCTCYLDPFDCSDFTVSNPIFKDQARNLWFDIKEILKNYYDENLPISRDLQNIKERLVLTTAEIDSNDIYSPIREFLNKKYGSGIKYYGEVYSKLVQFERSFSELNNAVAQKGTVADCQTELGRYQVNAHTLLEQAFIASFGKYFDMGIPFKVGEISKNNSSPELLRAYILKLGFECDDETIYGFLKGVTITDLKRIFSSPDKKARVRINLWVVANIICGAYDSSLPICTLGYKTPHLIQALQKTLSMRNPAKHGSSQIELLSIDECREIYNYCHRIIEILFQLKDLLPEIEQYDFVRQEISPQVKVLVNEQLKKVLTDNNEIFTKAKIMCEAFYGKQAASFYSDCENYLKAFYFSYLDKLFDDETRFNILRNLPDDRDLLRNSINRILSYNGIHYDVRSVIKREKLLIDFNEDEKITLTGIMYLLVLFVQEKNPALFKKINKFEELLAVTDQVVELRGHSEEADFSKDEEKCRKLLDQLLSFINENKE